MLTKIKLLKVTNFSKANYEGFVLKKGYYYGTDLLGRPVASSGYNKDGKTCLYIKTGENKWIRKWIPSRMIIVQPDNLK